jgi:hypothetical protein
LKPLVRHIYILLLLSNYYYIITNYLFREKGNFIEELPIPRVARGLYLEENDSDDDIYIARDPNRDIDEFTIYFNENRVLKTAS